MRKFILVSLLAIILMAGATVQVTYADVTAVVRCVDNVLFDGIDDLEVVFIRFHTATVPIPNGYDLLTGWSNWTVCLNEGNGFYSAVHGAPASTIDGWQVMFDDDDWNPDNPPNNPAPPMDTDC